MARGILGERKKGGANKTARVWCAYLEVWWSVRGGEECGKSRFEEHIKSSPL